MALFPLLLTSFLPACGSSQLVWRWVLHRRGYQGSEWTPSYGAMITPLTRNVSQTSEGSGHSVVVLESLFQYPQM
jgi:hypothetical protein